MVIQPNNLENVLSLAEQAKVEYKARLDTVVPELLEYSLKQMRDKNIAIQLTGALNSSGEYLSDNRKVGSTVFYAFYDGLRQLKVIYDRDIPKTVETPISKEEFLEWAKLRFERIEDVYNRLQAYNRSKPVKNFPSDDIL